MTEFELVLLTSMSQLLPDLLREHPYGIYELAQEFSKRLGQPIYEVMTPLTEALNKMTHEGKLHYDRTTNRIVLN